jgi:hypothetical protein
MSDTLYRIKWRVKATGATGHGAFCIPDKALADEWAKWCNKQYSEIEHWADLEIDADTLARLADEAGAAKLAAELRKEKKGER